MDALVQQIGIKTDLYNVLTMLGLIFSRILPVVYLCPFPGGRMLLSPVKIGISIVFSLILFPLLHLDENTHELLRGGLLFIYFAKEICIGFAIGFIGTLPFYAFESAGHLIDIQQNSSLANVLVPQMQAHSTLFGNFYFQSGLIVFLGINGHHFFIKALFNSFLVLPICSFPSLSNSVMEFMQVVVRLTADLLVIVIELSAPAIITIFLIDIMMALMNKIAPHFNVFIFSMPIKSLSGVIIMLCAFSFMVIKISAVMSSVLTQLIHIIELLR